MKVALLSLGCKVNQSELALLSSALNKKNKKDIFLVGLDQEPEVCVINTCAVTARSEYESRQLIRRAAATGASLIVTGCYAELNPQAVKGFKGVAHVVSNMEKDSIIGMIADESSSLELEFFNPGEMEGGRSKGGRSRYFLKVQDGCDYECSYCIVWKARGKSRSSDPEEVIARVRQAVEDGYKEVVLTGVHLGLYGKDKNIREGGGGLCLSCLVERILGETRIERVRLSSIEINEVDDRLLDLLKDRRMAPHLHLPLQSGDDGILKIMKRRYNSEYFIRKVEKVVKDLGAVGLGTDVIVGFPGEGEGEFQKTMSVIRRMPFSYVHVFVYSQRPGTWAAGLGGQIPGPVKKRRSAAVRELAAEKRRLFIDGMRGHMESVLIEDSGNEKNASGWGLRGVAGNYVKVLVPREYTVFGQMLPGELVNMEIVGQKETMAIGKPVIES